MVTLNSTLNPLFTIIFKRGEQGEIIVEELKAHGEFTKLPIEVQDSLINEFMIQMGEMPTHVVGGTA